MVEGNTSSQLLGTGGTYYVMAQLALRGFHASCTFGNAPNVDILVSDPEGDKTLSIQVKTAHCALRPRGRGETRKPHHLEWPLGRRLAKLRHENLWFIFVDLKGSRLDVIPDVYITPAAFVADFCEPWVDTVTWVRFHPPVEEMEDYKNDRGWERLEIALAVRSDNTAGRDGTLSTIQPLPARPAGESD